MKTLKMSTEIYDKETVLNAVEAYKELCTIKFLEANDYFECVFENCKYDETVTVSEFENYVIDLTNCI